MQDCTPEAPNIPTKRCCTCRQFYLITEFNKERSRKDGLSPRCIYCHRAKDKRYRDSPKGSENRSAYKQEHGAESKDKYKGRYKDKYKGRYKAADYADAMDAWHARNPGAEPAHRAVREAIKKGNLPRAKDCTCASCGAPAREYHHHNGYDDAYYLDVIPLCRSCHRAAHSPGQ